MYITSVLIANASFMLIELEIGGKHLEQIQNMLSYMVAAGCTKYMVRLPLYLQDMQELPSKHPAVYKHFKERSFYC